MSVYHVGQARGSVFRSVGTPFAAVVEVPAGGGVVQCPRHGEIARHVCEDCAWLRGEATTKLRCATSGSEPVSSWMTPAGEVARTTRDASSAAALAAADKAGAHHVLVLDAERVLVGIVCCCDLGRGDAAAATVAGCMPPDVYVTGPATSLSEALAAMRSLGISSLPVVDGPLVLGVITRGDLVRAGAPGADGAWTRTCTR